MEKLYKIIWIDDDIENMSEFIGLCEDNGMEIYPYKTRAEGKKAFEKDIRFWDAIIVDAWCYDESLEDSLTEDGLRDFYFQLEGKIPIFVLTGNDDLKKDYRFMRDYRPYIKSKDDDKLIEDILDAIKNRDETNIRNAYRDVFKTIETHFGCYAKGTRDVLIKALLALHVKERSEDCDIRFNDLRHILESICWVLKSYGLAPSECFSSKGPDVVSCLNYLTAYKGQKIYSKDELLPSYFIPLVKFMVYKCNEESHAHINSSMKYMYYGCCLQLCEIITVLNNILTNHPDIDKNQQLIVYAEYEGKEVIPIKDNENHWHYEECYIPIQTLLPNVKYRLKNVVPNTGKTKGIYKYFANFDVIRD